MRSLRLILGAATTSLAFATMTAPGAFADPGYLPSPASGAIATHLNLGNRHGYLNVTLSVGPGDQVVGLTVALPTAGGTWQAAAARTFDAPGLTCTGNAGSGPLYTCLTAADPNEEQPYSLIPAGKYTISLPVSRPTGPVDGTVGSLGLTRAGTYGDPPYTTQADTFGVLDRAVDAQSTAEIRELSLQPSGTGSLYTATMSLQVQIVSGEQVSDILVSLPVTAGGIAAYTVRDRQFSNGIACGEDPDQPATHDSYVIRCTDDQDAANPVWPPGNYTLNLHVASIGHGDGRGVVTVRHPSGIGQLVDDFAIRQYFNF